MSPGLRPWLRSVAVLVTATLGLFGLAGVAHADASADEVAASVNAQRAAVGQAPLARDAALDAMATEWAQHLVGGFDHSTNAWRTTRARAGYTLCCGENIAAGQRSATAVMSAWMSSDGHKRNILDGRYSHIGVGHVVVPGSTYGHYWVQVFAGYPLDRASHAAFIRALYRDFLGRSASASEVASWLARLEADRSRRAVPAALARSDEWLSTVISTFYRDTLNREPDAAGLRYWIGLARGDRPIARIAADFYASDEYFRTVGRGDVTTWVRDLYPKLLGRTPDAPGVAHWVGKISRGTSRGDVAYGFYQSAETSRVRVESLYRALLGRGADPSGLATWAPIVRAKGDLELAAYLAGSDEYFTRAQQR